MKRVSEVKTYKQFWNENFVSVCRVISQEVDKAFASISKLERLIISKVAFIPVAFLFMLAIAFGLAPFAVINDGGAPSSLAVGLWVACGLTFMVALITGISFTYKINRLKDRLGKAVDENTLFKNSFNKLHPNLQFVSFKSGAMPQLLKWKMQSMNHVPRDASWHEASPILTLKLNETYIHAQSVVWIYKRTNGKTTTTHYVQDGMIKIDLSTKDQQFNDFDFSLFSTSMKKWPTVNTENEEFNRHVALRSNDKIKARVLATPLAMESILKHRKEVKSRKYAIEKIGNSIYIRFAPHEEKVLVFDFKLHNNRKKQVEDMALDIVDDTYQIFALLSYIIIPPFLEL